MKILFLALALTGCGCSTLPPDDAVRETTLRLEFKDGICSGTAIGPDLILTAEHCVEDAELLAVNGTLVAAEVVKVDKARDMATVRVAGVRLARWATLGPKPAVGARVSWVGNPGPMRHLYREGYVAGHERGYLLLDVEGFFGDSGSGVMDSEGRLVAVVSAIRKADGFRMMVAYPVEGAAL